MTSDAGKMSDAKRIDYYMRWREVALVVTKRNGVLVCHKKHEGYFRDAVEQLKEDPWWKLQVQADQHLTMMAHPHCPEDELLIYDGNQLLRMDEFLKSKKGFGSFRKIMAPTEDGPVSFKTAFEKLMGSEN